MLKKFLKLEASSGIVLGICTLLALVIANSRLADPYHHLLTLSLFGLTAHHWINDGLMTIFFFVVGMEIKFELVEGELSSPRKAALPLLAALGGMLVPVLIYLFFNPTGTPARGLGIPMATDIAFAVCLLSLFGSRVPPSLKIFLLALAIIDDLGAVLVIALFYTAEISLLYLALAAAVFAAVCLIHRFGVRRYAIYVLFGALAWYAVFRSGVHATVAGVILGLLTPLRAGTATPLKTLVHALHPYVSFLIMPIFALANAGVDLGSTEPAALLRDPVALGIAFGLFIGKPLGIFLLSWLSVVGRLAVLPQGVRWAQLLGVGWIGGIGFTMALFIAGLALPPEFETAAKAGILSGSILSAFGGAVVLLLSLPARRRRV